MSSLFAVTVGGSIDYTGALPEKIHGGGRRAIQSEYCSNGVSTETRRGANERFAKLQVYCADCCDVEVVCDVFDCQDGNGEKVLPCGKSFKSVVLMALDVTKFS